MSYLYKEEIGNRSQNIDNSIDSFLCFSDKNEFYTYSLQTHPEQKFWW